MPTETDLCGLGMSPFLAAEFGNQPSNITGVGTTQTGATTINSKNVYVNAQTSQTAVVLAASAKVGSYFNVTNGTVSNSSVLCFVPSGHTLNGSAAGQGLNGAVTIAANTMAILFQVSLKQWYSK